MTYVDRIIERFGGVRALARAVGCAPANVGGWRARGTIPDRVKPDILAAARRLGLRLVRDDFFPLVEGCEAAAPAAICGEVDQAGKDGVGVGGVGVHGAGLCGLAVNECGEDASGIPAAQGIVVSACVSAVAGHAETDSADPVSGVRHG